MTKQKRKEYLILTSCAVAVGVLLYTVPLGIVKSTTNVSLAVPLGLTAIMGGIFFGAVISAIILAANFFSKRGLAFKIVAVCLFPITMIATFYAGFFSFVPYAIYNIVKLCEKDGTQNPATETNGCLEQPEQETVEETSVKEK